MSRTTFPASDSVELACASSLGSPLPRPCIPSLGMPRTRIRGLGMPRTTIPGLRRFRTTIRKLVGITPASDWLQFASASSLASPLRRTCIRELVGLAPALNSHPQPWTASNDHLRACWYGPLPWTIIREVVDIALASDTDAVFLAEYKGQQDPSTQLTAPRW
jgi:hypothetical protein